MAQDIVDLVSKRLKDYGLTFSPCNTKGLAIFKAGDVGGSKNFDAFVEQKVDVAKGIRH